MTVENTVLLIAGPFHENIIKMIELYKNIFASIVISTYNDKNIVLLKREYSQNEKIKVIENSLPDTSNLHNSQNIYYQCFSVVNGLKYCKKENAIKLRSDEFYNGLDSLIVNLPNNKLSTNNIFVRDVSYKPFHLSDHVIVGKVRLLKNIYNDLKNYIEIHSKNDILEILNEKTPAETKIFLFAFFNLLGFCKLDWYKLEEKCVFDFMKKYFYIFDVVTLEPYIIKSSVVGEIRNYKKFVKSDTNLFLRYSESIDDLSPKNAFERYLFKIKYKIKKVVL